MRDDEATEQFLSKISVLIGICLFFSCERRDSGTEESAQYTYTANLTDDEYRSDGHALEDILRTMMINGEGPFYSETYVDRWTLDKCRILEACADEYKYVDKKAIPRKLLKLYDRGHHKLIVAGINEEYNTTDIGGKRENAKIIFGCKK